MESDIKLPVQQLAQLLCIPDYTVYFVTQEKFMQYKYIFFDLDGTLTDPGIGITNSVMYALDKFGIHADRESLYRFIGPPLVDSFMEFYGFAEEKARKAVEYYREYFSVTGLFENKI